ncbi:MAG TPA: DUF2127 domain-containing protein [Planctomycetota bacterium]|nr:DUF2127 domain-containing protein [Planctomycetota bacterium]
MSSGEMPKQRLTQRLGKQVKAPDFGLKLIVFFKLCKATFLLLVAFGAFSMIHRDVHGHAERAVRYCHLNPAGPHIQPFLDRLTGVTTKHEVEVGSGAILFAIFILIEAWGLWNRRIWAEFITIIATSLLIPVEVYEIFHHFGVGKILMLVVNVLIVLYLARHHYLFLPGPIGRWLHAHLGSKEVEA